MEGNVGGHQIFIEGAIGGGVVVTSGKGGGKKVS